MVEFETEVIEIIQRTQDVKSFRFRPVKDAIFRPGQFFSLAIDIGREKNKKFFSFSNSPREMEYIEFTKRITQSPFSKTLDGFMPGERAQIKMPFGNFTFEGEYKKVAFLSGGIGITPIRSMCRFVTDRRLSVDMVLVYGNSREEDIVFREDFDEMAKINKNFKIIHTLTSQDISQKWTGRKGYIDDKMIREEIPDYTERVFFSSGPPKMVDSIVDILENRLGLDAKQIRRENFAGY